jgi:hypothetical protein
MSLLYPPQCHVHTILLPSDPNLNFRFSLSIIAFSGFMLMLEQDNGGGEHEREGWEDGTVGMAEQDGAQERAGEL